jgi:cytochrome c
MDSFEMNKMAGAFLGTVFVIFSLSILSEALFHHEAPEKPGYIIASAEGESSEGGESGGEAPADESAVPLLASADAAAGETVFKKCASCHSIDNGGANKVGPNLWNIVNRPIGGHEGFAYSGGMKEFGQGGSVTWDFTHLDGFLAAPKKYVAGTAMGFAGVKNTQERANLIAYLRNQADSPAPLPEAGAAPAEGAEAPAAPAEGAEAPAAPAEGAAPAEKPADNSGG